MSNEILIEGFDTPEADETIRLIEAGVYDLSDENVEGWWSSLKKTFKKVVKPLTSSLKPVADLAKVATNVPVLSNFIPGKGVIKMGLGIFDDIQKIEEHTGKKFKFTNKATKNVASAMYLKGYKDGRADEAKEQIARNASNSKPRFNSRSRSNRSSRARSRFSRR